MKLNLIVSLMFSSMALNAQGFECDGSIFIVVYTQSEGVSRLYKLNEENRDFTSQKIELSENRRLTSLAYNVLDEHLYALDADTYELVKIDRNGLVTSRGRPEAIDTNYIFNSGTISPDGAGIYLIGYSQEFNFDNRFYTINLSREDLYAGYLGVTGDQRVEVHDFATDPLSGTIFGFENSDGRLVQVGIGGQIASLDYPSTGVTNMDGVFFNQKGELFGFAAQRGIFAIDKLFGNIEYLERGPEGTNADACSCPYTSTFEKQIEPRNILPCQEFEVTYRFYNSLGIGQTWVKLRDTFPEGFEVLSIEGNIVFKDNIIESDANVVALDNLIYLMRENEIKVKVRAPSDFIGDFKSQATHWDFPKAFGTFQFSDDPGTELKNDKTSARVISENEINFEDNVKYSCDGQEITIASPFVADEYLWSNGSVESSITVEEIGWYTLFAENDCVIFLDSIYVAAFEDNKTLTLSGRSKITLGESLEIKSSLNRGNPVIYNWEFGEDSINCSDCSSITIQPKEDITVTLTVMDEDGCTLVASTDIFVEQMRYFYAANAFSPNSDGVNDHFFLQSSSDGIIKSFSVFDRWGGEVYNRSNIPLNIASEGWNGKSADHKLKSGVYMWIAELEYFDGFQELRSGAITLIDPR